MVQSLLSAGFLSATLPSLLQPGKAEAALLQFPATELKNEYFLVIVYAFLHFAPSPCTLGAVETIQI